MKKSLSFNEMPDAMASIIEMQSQILSTLQNQKQDQPAGKEILTIAEATEFLSINRSTLWKWEKEGKVKSFGIDGRRYYKRANLIESLVPVNH